MQGHGYIGYVHHTACTHKVVPKSATWEWVSSCVVRVFPVLLVPNPLECEHGCFFPRLGIHCTVNGWIGVMLLVLRWILKERWACRVMSYPPQYLLYFSLWLGYSLATIFNSAIMITTQCWSLFYPEECSVLDKKCRMGWEPKVTGNTEIWATDSWKSWESQ